MLKSFITYGLSILLLSAVVHVDTHHHDHHDGYNLCDIDCDNKEHGSMSHQCEKCLNSNNRPVIRESIVLSYDINESLVYCLDESFRSTYSYFRLYSRPPPNLL